jgi:hypothetical protein
MSKEVQFFFKKMLLFSLILAGISIILYDSLLKDYYLKIFPFQFLLIAFVTAISHLRLIRAKNFNIMRFNTRYLSVTGIKLFIYLLFIIIYFFLDRANALNFVASFFVLYIGFTIFEVSEVSNFLRNNSNTSN